MAYYNGKKVLSVVKTDQAQFPTYEGSYNITENGTLQTAYKALTDNIVVNVPKGGIAEQTLSELTPNWSFAFCTNYGRGIFGHLTDLSDFDFSESNLVTNTAHMFDNCKSLTRVPLFDTSEVTNMSAMFQSCNALLEVPSFNTSKVRSMDYMFSACQVLQSIPSFDTAEVTNMAYMFSQCYLLQSVPLFNTSKVTSMAGMFQACRTLTEIPAFDMSNVTHVEESMLYGCSNLEEIHLRNIGISLNISYSTKFTREALNEIIGNLKVVSSTKTLTLGSTNLAKLTAEDRAVATNKGWTLA